MRWRQQLVPRHGRLVMVCQSAGVTCARTIRRHGIQVRRGLIILIADVSKRSMHALSPLAGAHHARTPNPKPSVIQPAKEIRQEPRWLHLQRRLTQRARGGWALSAIDCRLSYFPPDSSACRSLGRAISTLYAVRDGNDLIGSNRALTRPARRVRLRIVQGSGIA